MSELVFLKGEGDLSGDPRLAQMAKCIVWQQDAGFRNRIDLREAKCPHCGASGFNSGWGYFSFSCGREVMPDGEETEPCSSPKKGERP